MDYGITMCHDDNEIYIRQAHCATTLKLKKSKNVEEAWEVCATDYVNDVKIAIFGSYEEANTFMEDLAVFINDYKPKEDAKPAKMTWEEYLRKWGVEPVEQQTDDKQLIHSLKRKLSTKNKEYELAWENFSDRVRKATDFLKTINRYTRLEQIDDMHYFGTCPFCGQETFAAHKTNEFWYCFGCGKGGNVFKLISLLENISYTAAIKRVGKHYGLIFNEKGN